MDSRKLALLCREYADNRKGENIVLIDVQKLSSVTDYFVVVTGSSEPHLRAIVEEITEKLHEEHNLRPNATDGGLHTGWIVLDYFDVMVHVQLAEVRAKYDLEGLWSDAPRVRTRKPAKRKTPLASL